MGTKYTTTAVSGYNATPPADDGTQVSANKVTWDKHKTKLGDPLNTAIASINSKLVTALSHGPTAKTGTYTTTAADYDTVLECSGTFTVTLLAVATAGAGYFVTVKNAGTGVITLTSASTIDGLLNFAMAPGQSVTVMVNDAGTLYMRVSMSGEDGFRYVGKVSTAAATWEFIDLDQASDHLFVFRSVYPSDDAVTFHMRTSPDAGAGPTYSTSYSNMSWGRSTGSSAGAFTTIEAAAAANLQLGVFTFGDASAVEFGVRGHVQIDDVGSGFSTAYRTISGVVSGLDESTVMGTTTVAGSTNSSGVIKAVEFFFSAGTLASGTIDHYVRPIQTG